MTSFRSKLIVLGRMAGGAAMLMGVAQSGVAFDRSSVLSAPALDVSEAYAFPVPFRRSTDSRIVFTNLSTEATVRIFTLDGRLVSELRETDGDGVLLWPVTNDAGEPLASDVFLYIIENNEQVKTGKIVVW